jgi:NDP-sugar pyrophosphorylase family protein
MGSTGSDNGYDVLAHVAQSLNGNGAAHNGGAEGARAIIFAGGRGTRLAPYTSVLPKPLMPIGDRSILELVINQLSESGVADVTLCVGYLSHLIEAVVGDGSTQGVNVTYVREQEALGTAAPLRLVEGLDKTFFAMNGDVLTTLDFGELLRHHRETGSIVTIATRERPIQIDYGVLHLRPTGDRVYKYTEKPKTTSTVSMGIYVLEPEALEYIPEEGYFDFPDLVKALLRARQPVGALRFDGLWFDIGRRDDYEEAVTTWLQATMERNGHGNGNGNGNGNGYVNGNGAVHEMATELVRGSGIGAGTADLEER